MSTGTLTITVNNGNVNAGVQLIFTGGAGLTCTTDISGAILNRSMTSFVCNTLASANPVNIILYNVQG